MLMILLRITGYGWMAVVLLVLSIFVGIGIIKRRDKHAKPGCVGVAYVSLVVFILLSFSTMLTGMLGSFVLDIFTLSRYEAKVISISAYEKHSRKSKKMTTMYRSTVAFTTADGTLVEIPTDISSSERGKIGEIVTVGYKPGMETAEELSGSKYLLMAGGAVMLLVMGYFAVAGIFYAMGWGMSGFYRFGMNLVMYLILPLAMLFMLGGIGYVVVLYFTGNKRDMPIWAVVVCCFFCLVLLGGMLGYVRMLIEKGGRIR